MTGLKVSKNVILPHIEGVRDPETKRIIRGLLRVIRDLNNTYYSDLAWLEQRIGNLEP